MGGAFLMRGRPISIEMRSYRRAIDADYVVTEDKDLIKHTNGVCINVEQALRLVGEVKDPSARPV